MCCSTRRRLRTLLRIVFERLQGRQRVLVPVEEYVCIIMIIQSLSSYCLACLGLLSHHRGHRPRRAKDSGTVCLRLCATMKLTNHNHAKVDYALSPLLSSCSRCYICLPIPHCHPSPPPPPPRHTPHPPAPSSIQSPVSIYQHHPSLTTMAAVCPVVGKHIHPDSSPPASSSYLNPSTNTPSPPGTTNTVLPPSHPSFDASKPGQVCPVTNASTDHHLSLIHI